MNRAGMRRNGRGKQGRSWSLQLLVSEKSTFVGGSDLATQRLSDVGNAKEKPRIADGGANEEGDEMRDKEKIRFRGTVQKTAVQ